MNRIAFLYRFIKIERKAVNYFKINNFAISTDIAGKLNMLVMVFGCLFMLQGTPGYRSYSGEPIWRQRGDDGNEVYQQFFTSEMKALKYLAFHQDKYNAFIKFDFTRHKKVKYICGNGVDENENEVFGIQDSVVTYFGSMLDTIGSWATEENKEYAYYLNEYQKIKKGNKK